jgi:DNA-binding NarL/FixJ family response regulator
VICIALLGNPPLSIHRGIVSALDHPYEFMLLGDSEFAQGQNNRDAQVILLDANSPKHYEMIRIIRADQPKVKILAFSDECELSLVREGIRMGLDGYVWTHDLLEDLPEIIRSLYTGKAVFSRSITQGLLSA